ncbi:D-2-hydroxyacid dehydrogenase [Rhodohalobacter sp. SW132]|uniref:D-2-hydroxyacid dehydrogenase n=1 Tax=Rhodohalobacter sp. SW132 TaxID=2293433 RepID=UPI000E22FFDD|nr:D-2-hydroxyacid dehydrogenase [Rhodohalobacter sp. SW132]REL24639.1 D-2-hydroxyacid dehydrogenase [Rhodohalobacter sp. SW132]
MKIVFLDIKTIGDVPNLDDLKKLGEFKSFEVTKPEETAERIQDADVVITNKVVLDEEIIWNANHLKLICVAATGMNNIDREAAENSGVQVKNVAGYASDSVAQGTFAMILHLQYNLRGYDQYIKSGGYSKSDIFTNLEFSYTELKNKRFGIIGLGNIGQRVAGIAEAFGAEVAYYSTSGKNTDQPYLRLDLEELLETSDILSIHAPLNENTENLIRYEELKQMKPSALLINTGRGGIVNESDLAQALDDDQIAGAGLDVFEQEPINPDNPLLRVKNREKIIMTPHITWASVEARTELVDGIISNIKSFKGS